MNSLIPVLPTIVWDVFAIVRTVLVYAFPVFMLGGLYTAWSSVEQMILVWGGLYGLLTLPAAVALGSWRGVVAAGAPLVLSVVLAAFAIVLRGATTRYIDAARDARAAKKENTR
jgi:hypothetical protein